MGRNLGPLNIKDSYEGLVQISGSQLTDGSGSLISSLDITASQAGTAGYAGTAGFADTATSASFADQSGTSGYATTALSASFATTASYALNQTDTTYDLDSIQVGSDVAITLVGSDASLDTVTLVAGTNITLTDDGSSNITIDASVSSFDTGSLMVTGSVTDATLTFTKGDGSTFPLTVNNVANATSALLAVSASHAVNADNAITAQTASFLPSDTNLNINSITASFASFTSASIGYLQTITGSAKIIGDAFIILNNNLPTERYAGLVVQDSGSGSPLTTSSLQYDGQTDDWFYEYSTDGGVTTDHGVAMFGPEYSVKGSPTYLTNNTIPKGDGGHHLNDSNITDDGTLVTIDSNVSASGYVSASTYYGDGSNLSGITTDTGSLLTTASYSDPLLTFTKGDGSTFNVTISSDPFPYTGSAIISGSLSVDGVLAISGSTAISSSTLGTGSLIDNLGQEGVATTTNVQHIVYCTQAEYDALTPDANTLYVINGSEVLGNTVISGSLIGEVNTIPVVSNTGSLDCSLGNMFILALVGGQDVRLEASNVQQGQVINIRILNDLTAGTISFDTNVFKFEGGTPFTATATAGAIDILTTTCFNNTSYLFTVGVKDFQI